MSRVETAGRIFRNEGIKSLVSATISFTKRRVSDVLINTGRWLQLSDHKSYNELCRTDSSQRWAMIKPHLELDGGSCLDIGCADGFFTAEAAKLGYYTIGIDSYSNRLENARRLHQNKNKTAFIRETITPENVSYLPKADIVLLLTVFHHWCGAFGNESAKEMMRVLATNSQRIIFEPPGVEADNFSKISNERPVGENESSKEYYDRMLKDIFSNEVNVEYLEETEYDPTIERCDPMFVIHCSDYN